MECIFENKEKDWNSFLLQNNGSFLQSFEWGKFQEQNKKKVWFLRFIEEHKTFLQVLIVKEIFLCSSKSFLYIPFGPTLLQNMLEEKKQAFLNVFLEKLKSIAQDEQCVFIKIEPFAELALPKDDLLVPSLGRIQPLKTIILNIEKNEEDLLKSFHITTRYNIRLAEKKKIEVLMFNKENSDIDVYADAFYAVVSKTSDRKKFGIYSEEYYKNLLNIYTNDFKTELFLAECQGNYIAGYLVVFFGNMAICLHGGSDYQYRHLKGPFILQWKQIIEAKKRGCKEYDFWGIDGKKWPGVTYFKQNFRGAILEYPQAGDLVFQKGWYALYTLIKKLQ